MSRNAARRAAHFGAPILDLNKRHFEVTLNGILVIGTWVRMKGQGVKHQPCLALLHAGRQIHDTVAVVIPLEGAWRWALHGEVGDPAHCVASICDWLCDGLLPGDPSNKRDYVAIMDAINQRLPDLIAMPPRPLGDTVAIGEARKLDKTGRIIEEREITIDV